MGRPDDFLRGAGGQRFLCVVVYPDLSYAPGGIFDIGLFVATDDVFICFWTGGGMRGVRGLRAFAALAGTGDRASRSAASGLPFGFRGDRTFGDYQMAAGRRR